MFAFRYLEFDVFDDVKLLKLLIFLCAEIASISIDLYAELLAEERQDKFTDIFCRNGGGKLYLRMEGSSCAGYSGSVFVCPGQGGNDFII